MNLSLNQKSMKTMTTKKSPCENCQMEYIGIGFVIGSAFWGITFLIYVFL